MLNVKHGHNENNKMANFLTAEQAKVYSDHAKLDIELYKQRLASLI